MPNDSYEDAIKEAYACAPAGVVFLHTLQISHPDVAEDIFLVQDRTDKTCTLETAEEELFTACAFRFSLPTTGEDGLQELSIAIDNVNRVVSDYLDQVKDSNDPVAITYRPYLSTDLTTPQMDPPLVLYLRDVNVNVFEVTGKATFADILNKRFLTDLYTRQRFPSLAN